MTSDSSLHGADELPVWPSAEDCAQDVVNRVGKDIRLALPLGLGKANRFTNALYAMACAASWLSA